VVERDDAVGDALDDVHVVLDDEDGVAGLGAQAPDQLGHLVRLRRVHAGGRLVEEQQARVGGRRAGDLEPAPVGVRERVRRLVPPVAHEPLPEERELLLGHARDLALLPARPRQAQHRLHEGRLRVAVGRRHDVLLDRHVQEEAQRLERARHAELRDPVRRQAHEVAAGEEDLAPVGPVDARDHVEERRLAGAVGADHADDLAFAHDEVEVTEHLQTPEREP
jgi:hypothetical protein